MNGITGVEVISGIRRGKLALGSFLLVTFLAVLVWMFQPIFNGRNLLQYLDNLYNSISKASAYYVPKLRQEVKESGSTSMRLNLTFQDPSMAKSAARLLEKAGARVEPSGRGLTAEGRLESILDQALNDSDSLYHNRDQELSNRYGMSGRVALYTWWKTLGSMEKDLQRQSQFAAAEMTGRIKTKAVEGAYNYYGIVPQPITERWGTVVFSLIFYVLYTVWYGYALTFLFEGLGYRF
jgi:hypothetical protein